MASLEEELTRKVNRCHDIVTNATLDDKYKAFRE